jgi:hypothetical protein
VVVRSNFTVETSQHFSSSSHNPSIRTKINKEAKLSNFECRGNENRLKLLFRLEWKDLIIPIRLLYFTLQKGGSESHVIFI